MRCDLKLRHSILLSVVRDYVDISIAVATPRGLVVPVLRNVESMDYPKIEVTISQIAQKARKGI